MNIEDIPINLLNLPMNIPMNLPMNIHMVPMDLSTDVPEVEDIPEEIPEDIPEDLPDLIPLNQDFPVEYFPHMGWLWDLYLYTHIIPSQEDFLTQINNYDHVYLVLYWNKLEHLYLRFIEEEMDLEAIVLMRAEDFAYFGMG